MSTSEDAPLLTASSRRRGGAALAAVVLALAGGLAFAVANRSDATTSHSSSAKPQFITTGHRRRDRWHEKQHGHGGSNVPKPPKSSPGEEPAQPGGIVVDGIPVGTAEDTTKLIVQNAMNDVIPVVESPDQITVELQNVPGQPNSQRVVATIYMGKPYKTCGQAGFRTAQDCLDGVDLDYDAPPSLVASVNEAINNGKLKERLLYWADHFDADWADDLAPAAGPANNAMTQLNSGLHGKVGSIEKWLLIVIVVLGAVCLLCCVCCIIHVGTCGIL